MPPKPIRQQYYLDPFPVHSDLALGSTRKKYVAKTNCIVIPTPAGENSLANVEDYATLLIDGHGTTERPNVIEAMLGEVWLGRDVVNLSDLLQNCWRLPTTHVKIRMLSCWGFGFARNLAIELGRRGYNHIHVAGYTGKAKVGAYDSATGRGRNPVETPDDEHYCGKDRVQWFDASGHVVNKPDVGLAAVVGESDSLWD
jgi:hypothetical protein